jgi:hypothetical protein
MNTNIYQNKTKIEPSTFPFFTESLSPTNNEETWIEKTGLTAQESLRIENYVQEHESDWQSLTLKQVIRIPKEESNLPRTIQIFSAYGRLCIQVLCKTKNNLKMIGQGEYKKAKVSVEWRTKTLWTEYIAHGEDDLELIQQGLNNHDKIGYHVSGVFPSPQGRLTYEKDGKKKYNFFGPLRLGDATSYIKELREQKLSVAHQLLNILNELEKKNICHNDMKISNFFIYFSEKKKSTSNLQISTLQHNVQST